jgi:hypothetical protein
LEIITSLEDALNQAWPAGVATYALRGIDDAIKLATTCRQYWFRGHSQEFKWLLPAVHRDPLPPIRSNIEFWPGSGSAFERTPSHPKYLTGETTFLGC